MDNRPQRSPAPGAPLSEGAATKLAARRRRVRAIRGRVAGLSVATLMATSGVVVVQMVTGNDPALARSPASSDVTTSTRTTTEPTASPGPTATTGTSASTPATVKTKAS
jgi:hypothetical protein